jgi:nitrogen-specific signal transduction histidine kinase
VAAPAAGVIYATGRDVTAEKEQAEALSKAEQALRQAQKMEAVGQLTGGIAHDFNNMLVVVMGNLTMLQRRLDANEPRLHRLASNALEGAARAASLTQQLLTFARQQPMKLEVIAVNQLVANMSDLLHRALGGSARIETILCDDLWRIYSDSNQLENAILNLAVNARDAMPDGGALTVQTANADLAEADAARLAGLPAGQYVMIAVTDTGAGMTPEVIARAFDPFFTTKGVGKGTGLGLSQVHGFIHQGNGHIKIHSELGVGTTVTMYLPRSFETAPDRVPAKNDSAAVAKVVRPTTVLVVEDEHSVRALGVEALRELGYTVLEADGAESALTLLDAHPQIELLFTDVVMPEVNGKKLADEAVQRRPGLKVLFTTGYTRDAIVHNGVLDPGVNLIGKPFTLEQLGRKLAQVLG